MKCKICGLNVTDGKEARYQYHMGCLISQVEGLTSSLDAAKTTNRAQERHFEAKAKKKHEEYLKALRVDAATIENLTQQLEQARATGQMVNQFVGGGMSRRSASPATVPQDLKCKQCTHQMSSHLSGVCAVSNKDCTKAPEPEEKKDRFTLIDLE